MGSLIPIGVPFDVRLCVVVMCLSTAPVLFIWTIVVWWLARSFRPDVHTIPKHMSHTNTTGILNMDIWEQVTGLPVIRTVADLIRLCKGVTHIMGVHLHGGAHSRETVAAMLASAR